ncbi:MAG: 30S ribosomal protein S8 [Candidatus Firestonebacteria bacterium]
MDPIADMFTRIRNANKELHEQVDIPSSKLKLEIVKLLLSEGYIQNYRHLPDAKGGIIRIFLKYLKGNKRVIAGIKRVSKSSLRIYKRYREIPRIFGGFGSVLISTSLGIMTGKEASAKKIGGEIIGYIW